MIAHKFQNSNGGTHCEVRVMGVDPTAFSVRCNGHKEDHEGFVVPYADPMPQTREELEELIKKVIRECVLSGALDERAL